MKKISILIPCYNEQLGISKVIRDIPRKLLRKFGFEVEVIVINNNSTDLTEEIVANYRVKRIQEMRKGKGFAMKAGFEAVSPDTDYVVMIDGDHTYKPKELFRLVEPLVNNFCDCVVGSRIGGKMKRGSFQFKNRVANWFFTFLVRLLYIANVTDVLSGYFAWKKSCLDELKKHITSEGFAIEMEMITKMEKLGYQVYSVPITYDRRTGTSKLNPFADGIHILVMLFKNLFWSPYKKSWRVAISDVITSLFV